MTQEKMISDLKKSRLTPSQMDAKVANVEDHLAACSIKNEVDGYAIPYFDINGKPLKFYRVRLFGFKDKDNKPLKYLQPKKSENHLYFPKDFMQKVRKAKKDGNNYVILTEGEKKAACACSAFNYPAVALGGVNSWRNRKIKFPGESIVKNEGGHIVVKIPHSMSPYVIEDNSNKCVGMDSFIEFLKEEELTLICIYDNDEKEETKLNIQKSLFDLFLDLRLEKIQSDKIKKLDLPDNDNGKVGLDDFLVASPFGRLDELIEDELKNITHPDLRNWLQKNLQQKPKRQELFRIATAILIDLDDKGQRYVDASTSELYYFNNEDKSLLKAEFEGGRKDAFNNTQFAKLLFRRYEIFSIDRDLLKTLGSLFNENGVKRFRPQKILYCPPNENKLYYQIDSTQYALIDKSGMKIYENGENDIMFQDPKDYIDDDDNMGDYPIDLKVLKKEFQKMRQKPLSQDDMWWAKVLDGVKLNESDDKRLMAALLYYINPFLNKWRGLEIPIEIHVGQPGCGKTSLFYHRLNVLTGNSDTLNMPTDYDKWVVFLKDSGAMTIFDNVNMNDKKLENSICDDLCRFITSRNQTITSRQLYTQNKITIRIGGNFGFTAVDIPFWRKDVLERCFIMNFGGKIKGQKGVGYYHNSWVENQMRNAPFKSRERWLAHHFCVLMYFFNIADKKWDTNYISQTRLAHFEQTLCIMASVFKIPEDKIDSIGSILRKLDSETKEKVDPAFEAMGIFCHYAMEKSLRDFATTDIQAYLIKEFPDLRVADSPKRLGQYLKKNSKALEEAYGLVLSTTKVQNANSFYINSQLITEEETE